MNDAAAWQPLASYIGYRGGSTLSLQLSGYGIVDITFGNGGSGTVELWLGGSKRLETSGVETEAYAFVHQEVLELRPLNGGIIELKGIAFRCMMQKPCRASITLWIDLL